MFSSVSELYGESNCNSVASGIVAAVEATAQLAVDAVVAVERIGDTCGQLMALIVVGGVKCIAITITNSVQRDAIAEVIVCVAIESIVWEVCCAELLTDACLGAERDASGLRRV